MVRQTQLYQISYIYIKVFTQFPWTLMYSSFTLFWILIQKVLIRLLPYLTYKFNINKWEGRCEPRWAQSDYWSLIFTSIFYMLLEEICVRNIFQNIHKALKYIYIKCLWVLLTHAYWFRATGGYICGCGRPSNLVEAPPRIRKTIFFFFLEKQFFLISFRVSCYFQKNLFVKYLKVPLHVLMGILTWS